MAGAKARGPGPASLITLEYLSAGFTNIVPVFSHWLSLLAILGSFALSAIGRALVTLWGVGRGFGRFLRFLREVECAQVNSQVKDAGSAPVPEGSFGPGEGFPYLQHPVNG